MVWINYLVIQEVIGSTSIQHIYVQAQLEFETFDYEEVLLKAMVKSIQILKFYASVG